jgi:uronate dehydrogenase
VHLAIADQKADYQSSDVPFSVNVKGTYNVFEAARLHGLSKIVVMSSAPVHLPFGTDKQTDAHSDWKSSSGDDHLYDLTKRLQETIAMDFCDTFAMNAVVLRAGHIVDGRKQVDPRGRPLSEVDYCRGGWVCRYDLADTCLKALELRRPGYSTYSAIGSEQARKPFDIDRTERELGVSFKPRSEQYGPTAGVRPRPT